MNRLIIFASYDQDSIIDESLVFLVKNLSTVGDVIFIMDNNVNYNELLKIDKFVFHTITGRHGEYDFGSYKRGLLYALEKKILGNYDYVIFCNDSVYGPFYPLKNIFDRMESQLPDVWGFTKNTITEIDHLQSYFLAFSKKIIGNPEIQDFFRKITRLKSKKEIVHNYEYGISKLILDLGFKLNSFYSWDENFIYDPSKKYFLEMIKKGFPFLKKSLLRENVYKVPYLYKYLEIKSIDSNYPFDCIQKNLERIVPKKQLKKSLYIKFWKNLFFSFKKKMVHAKNRLIRLINYFLRKKEGKC